MKVVVKLGSSSVTNENGGISLGLLDRVASEISELSSIGNQFVLVTSGAIAAGLFELGYGSNRPSDVAILQAASAVGQGRLIEAYRMLFAQRSLKVGQVLLDPGDFAARRQYLRARQTISELWNLGAIPVVNENDAIAVDEIRFGDNDRLAALTANLIGADLLILLTDQAGVYTGDPRRDEEASLIEVISEIDHRVAEYGGGAGTTRGTGGVSSKLQAAKMASFSGVTTVIAAAERRSVIIDAVKKSPAGVGTLIKARDAHLPARKLWIAFATVSEGVVIVDQGARRALEVNSKSLLPAGIRAVEGDFFSGAAASIADESGEVFAKGIVRRDSGSIREIMGRKSSELADDGSSEVVHRDDLVLLRS